MEKYSKAVSEMYSQFKRGEAHPMEKYIGKSASYKGERLEVVGYRKETDGTWELIVEGTKIKGWGWKRLNPQDVVFKDCERYLYVGINDVTD